MFPSMEMTDRLIAETGQLNVQFSSLGRLAFYRYLSATSADSSTEDARGQQRHYP